MVVPCNCCPTRDTRCGLSAETFSAVTLVANPAGYGVFDLNISRDGITNQVSFSGFSTPAVQITPANSPTIDYTLTPARDRIRGVRIYNQGGGNLNDSDGLGGATITFLDPGAVVLATGTLIAGNGGAPFTFLLPAGATVNNVATVRMTNLTKVNPAAGVAPLWREFQALQLNSVYSCRTPNGVLHWYDPDGTEVLVTDIVACP